MISVHTQEKIAKSLLWISGLIVIAILAFILGYILIRGIGVINWHFITAMPRDRGIYPMIIGTILLVTISILISTPIGIGGGIYLTEYAGKTKLSKLITFCAEWLSGIPSIIFGLFGFAFFVLYLGWGWSLISGSATIALMILSVIIRTTQEALKMVPNSYRYGSLALGATQWQTIRIVILKSASPGILSGIILGIGRAAGDTAAVLLTAGTIMRIPNTIFESIRPLSLHLYFESMFKFGAEAEAIADGTAVILIFIIFILNLISRKLINLYTKSLRK